MTTTIRVRFSQYSIISKEVPILKGKANNYFHFMANITDIWPKANLHFANKKLNKYTLKIKKYIVCLLEFNINNKKIIV